MSRYFVARKWLRSWLRQHRAQLRLCLRMSTSAVAGLAVAQLLQLPLPLWTVLTAVLLTQISVGRSLKASTDYLASTLGGAVYAGTIGALVPHDSEIALLAAVALAVAPAALVSASNPRFSAAPVSAVMVLFGPTITHAGPKNTITALTGAALKRGLLAATSAAGATASATAASSAISLSCGTSAPMVPA